MLVGLTKDKGGDDISREGRQSPIDGERTATGAILVDLGAEDVELLPDDGLKVRDAALGEERKEWRLAKLVKMVLRRREDGARDVQPVAEVVVLIHPARPVEGIPEVGIADVQFIRVDSHDRPCAPLSIQQTPSCDPSYRIACAARRCGR